MLSRFNVFRFASLLGSGALVAVSFAACSDRDGGGFDDPNPGPLTPEGGSADGPSCAFQCSPDLKKVLKTCDGKLDSETTCPPDQGCGVDKCVDACTSAALSKGSVGCSFWTLPPDDGILGPGACFAAMVANTWDHPVNITADWGADPLDVSKSIYTTKMVGAGPVYTRLEGPLQAGQVAIVFLAQQPVPSDPQATRCPAGVEYAVKADPIRHGTAKTKAFHLKTDAPVSAYSIFPYGGAESFYPSSTLLLPVSSWEKNYIAVHTGLFGDPVAAASDRRTIQIIANEDGTEVSMRPVNSIEEGTDVEPAGAGEVKTWSLSRGQVLQITQSGNTIGSPIEANKPIGLFGGAPCSFLPAQVLACDYTQQQIPPFSQWGSEYALVPFASRIQSASSGPPPREIVPWTFVGAVDGTVLTYEPSKPPGAPATLSAGQAFYFMTDAIVSVKSQDTKHPFYAGVQMTGALFNGGTGSTGPGGGMVKGDPEFVNMVPSDQFLDRYVFFADYTYPDTTLTIVRRKTETGFRPVELECGGEITGFTPLDSKGEYEYTWVKLTVGGVPQSFPSGSCGYGRHEAHSDGPFSVTVWGIGKTASYGYAGGMGSRPINDAPLPILK